MKKKIFFVLIAFYFSLNLLQVQAQTQLEMDDQANNEYKKADKELNQVYNKILVKYKDNKVFLKKLKLAELAWIKYRDAEIEAIYPSEPGEDKFFKYGSAYPMCYSITLKEITKQRIKELKLWLNGTVHGNVCSGSRRWEY